MRDSFLKGCSAWRVVLLISAGLVGCDREIPFQVEPVQSINGYQLEGFVTDHLGTPIRDMPIALWYDYDFLDGDAPPRSYHVDDPTKNILVRVYDGAHTVRRILHEGGAPVGDLTVSWDEKDSNGKDVPSGIYLVDFSINAVSKFSYTVIVDGAVSTTTDSLGHYIIPNSMLPVGFAPAPLFASDGTTFLGNYQITSYVTLEFYVQGHRAAGVTLNQNQVTRLDYQI